MLAPILVVLLAAAPAAAQKQRPYTIQDQVTMRRVLSFAVSPDGSRVAYVLRTTDLEANKGRTDLWLVNTDGSNNRQLTTDPASDTDPQWAPDGKSLYFLSTRSGSSQVHRFPLLEGGEPVQVTKLPLDVGAYELSRDGTQLAVALEVFPDCTELDCTVKRLDEKKKSKATGQLYDSLFVRHWDTWADGRRNHLFVMPSSGGDKAVDVMKKMNADCPTKPFGGAEDFTWAPDGKSLVFSARDVGREEAWSTDFDLFQTDATGKTPPKKLTTNNKAWDAMPEFSPDGKWLAYTAHSRPGYESDKFSVMLREWPKGAEKNLSADGKWDHSAHSIAWSPDSKSVGVVAEEVGQSGLFLLDVATGQARTVYLKGTMGNAQPAGGSAWVVSLDDLKHPVDLFVVSEGGQARALTQVNAEALSGLKLGDYEQFSFTGAGGDKVYGYIVKPVDFDPKKKYPLAFLIHGGPQGSFGDHFHYRWNPQVYAGHGYAAVMIDFHGSTGYGQAFTDSIRLDWGGKPLEDLQKGLNAALEKYPFIDKNRVCALGASYGGFMINWIAGNWSEPFKCLVNHDGNLDERFAYYDTEELWFPEWDHGGTPWEKPEGFAKHNPVDHVAKWKTPMLVIHGGRDYRVVDTQGLSTFNVLQRRNIPSKLLYFPDENHWVLKPANSVLWHETVLGWLDQWTAAKK
jgi:dipeptidyl aminopeptidase/acylaminoacyl peptidase